MMIDINLHSYQDQLKLKKDKGTVYVFDVIRKKYMILQPEEMVRQLLVHFLISKGYPKEKIQVEKGINLNGLYRRFDIVVYDQQFEPYMLIECKSHKVNIDQSTFDQIASYNLEIRAPYLLVCNGVQSFCCALDFETKNIEHLSYIPDYQ